MKTKIDLFPQSLKLAYGLCLLVLLLCGTGSIALPATVNVTVGPGGVLIFSPATVTIHPGDTVQWNFDSAHHTVTSDTLLFYTPIEPKGATFSYTFQNAGTYNYLCSIHSDCCGMNGIITVAATAPTPSQPLNISTRMRVETGENVLIGGFIITGNASKKVIVRALGPSLQQSGIDDVLADPVVELRGSDGSLIASNDNWKDSQQGAIEASSVAPTNDLESAMVTTLAPGSYTAIVSGKNATTGVGLVEVYDLDQAADSKLANISTRGPVQTGSNVMIGGFILGGNTGSANVLVRAIGPSLTQSGISGALADPVLELHDSNGTILRSNDNWKDSQQAEIEATGIPPQNDLESAIYATLPPGAFTAVLMGNNSSSGVGLVELYRLP